MTRYRKRPLEVDAIQWTGDNWNDVCTAFPDVDGEVVYDVSSRSLIVHTVDGRMRCAQGDWLIRDHNGNFYPCWDMGFADLYEVVPAPANTSAYEEYVD